MGRKKRRDFEVFSLSFLDCVCCGFGAMLLLFVLTIGKQASDANIDKLQQQVAGLKQLVVVQRNKTSDLQNQIKMREDRIAVELSTRDVIKHDLTEMEQDFALILQQRANLKDERDRLLGEKQRIPTVDESPPIPIPNTQRRQYLTGFSFEGRNVVFMIEASGGMVGYTVDEAIQRVTMPDADKRKTEKWRRVIKAVHWIIANLTPRQTYQIVYFNSETKQLLPDHEGEWFEPLNRETTGEVLKALDEVTPRGGANLERAFITVRELFPSVDDIVLITDSLPTLSDSVPVGSITDDRDRERFFRAALREVPRQTPINTILFPMSGDPAAAFLFWQLADASHGSLISPAPSWPDI